METIKQLRESVGLSQDSLAKGLGVDRSTVAKWETSGVYPRGDKIPELAKLLRCTIDALYGREPFGAEDKDTRE
ncbi:MAG TPA: helix-turn-helix domain-containing protein [Candidatus Intestinimonas merdavium]|uniref:Helix-turn-helix domain-containing protein n=1 Tax=Candidatus Intestinimonas merdavium TaxID=2838622 RepID=A0A9D1Z8B1_9FIRM|nr:helix-turn-helix domain-containing protein [Candidatus Intestinimonas merdavium]